MSIKEISKVLDCFEGTVKSRLFKARKILQNELEPYYKDTLEDICLNGREANIGQSNFSSKPIIKEKYTLKLVDNDLLYSLSTVHDSTISKEEAIKIAEDFQAAQP